jgi:hypothetical protein
VGLRIGVVCSALAIAACGRLEYAAVGDGGLDGGDHPEGGPELDAGAIDGSAADAAPIAEGGSRDGDLGDARAADAGASDSGAVDGGLRAPPRAIFALTGGGAGSARDVAVGTDGRIVVSGVFTGELAFAGTTATGAGVTSGFVASARADGTPEWIHTVISADFVETRDVAITESGRSFVSGHANLAATFEGTTMGPYTSQYAFVIAHDAAGTLEWHHDYGGTNNFQAHDVVWDGPRARILVSGFYHNYTGPVAFETETLPVSSIDHGFLVAASETGTMEWVRRFQSEGASSADDVDVVGARVCVGGRYATSMNLDEAGAPELVASSSSYEGFVLGLALDGSVDWARTIGGPLTDQVMSVTVASGGDCIAWMRSDATVDFGAAGMTLARLGPSMPGPIWTVRYEGAPTMRPLAMVEDGAGNLYVAGAFVESPWSPFPGISITPVGGRDAFVAKHDPGGALVWIETFGSAVDDAAEGLALGPSGSVVAVATIGASTTIGGRALTIDGASDVVVLELAP